MKILDMVKERREDFRYLIQGSLETDICEVDMNTSDFIDKKIACETVDASENGLQFSSSTAVPIGAVLDIKVQFAENSAIYNLTGEVKWVKKSDRLKQYQVGMNLYEWLNTDIDRWKQNFWQIRNAI